MQDTVRSPHVRVPDRFLLRQVLVTLSAVLLAEGAAVAIISVFPATSTWRLRWLIAPGVALITGLLLGAWANHYLEDRLDRLLEISQAWLRGTLSLRIADRRGDTLGQLAEHLDVLAEHLAQDEQDLARLREQNTRLTDQVRALAVDEERERLARELHDGVKQHLFSLAMTASALRTRLDAEPSAPEEIAEMVREVETTAKTVQRMLTRLIEDLRPASLQDQGLAAALNDYTLLFGAREHILAYLDVQGNDTLLPSAVAEALYRVAQEGLHNVARHAQATRVDVSLRCLPEQVVLVIRDNGVGFDTSQAHHGLGLGNMQDRIVAVGGRLKIDSRIGSGTRVRAEVRLTEPRGLRADLSQSDRGQPRPMIENWAWLGQRLTIPVGQTWPWLPADQVHLREDMVETDRGPIVAGQSDGAFGLRTGCVLRDQRGAALIRIRRHRWGYGWKSEGARWALRYIRGPRGTMRMVLMRNGQPLAAMQQQGRLMSTWSEIVYDGRGYSLLCASELSGGCVLRDGAGEPVLTIREGDQPQVTLHRPVALALLTMVVVRVMDELAPVAGSTTKAR
jgi:NarL family two-component system sensor histidine kinase LiaS